MTENISITVDEYGGYARKLETVNQEYWDNLDITKFPLDLKKFAEHPKCTQAWYVVRDDGIHVACLLSAFMVALGFRFKTVEGSLSIQGPGWGTSTHHTHIRTLVNRAAKKLIPEELCHLPEDTSFPGRVIQLYDNGSSPQALTLLWHLIEKWPTKIGYAEKEQVILPKQELAKEPVVTAYSQEPACVF